MRCDENPRTNVACDLKNVLRAPIDSCFVTKAVCPPITHVDRYVTYAHLYMCRQKGRCVPFWPATQPALTEILKQIDTARALPQSPVVRSKKKLPSVSRGPTYQGTQLLLRNTR